MIARVSGWCLAALTHGVRLTWRAWRVVNRFHLRLRETLPCPRGHLAPVYGTWACGCGASFDGYAFDPCPICRRSCGWVPCPICQLPVRNPALG